MTATIIRQACTVTAAALSLFVAVALLSFVTAPVPAASATTGLACTVLCDSPTTGSGGNTASFTSSL